MLIRTRKGLDIPVDGKPELVTETGSVVRHVALLGEDYVGLEPRMLVAEGDTVSIGQPLFVHKRDAEIRYTAPGSGRISAINRGARRVLKSVVIELDDPDALGHPAHNQIPEPGEMSAEKLRELLLSTGQWTAFRTRPFSRVPHSRSSPRSIFVTAIDTHPLAANPEDVIASYPEAFALGLKLVAKLSDGSVYLCTRPDFSGPTGEGETIRPVAFAGPHPAGLPGTHIHHLDPVGSDRTVWHIGYQDVIAIGKLVAEGSIWTERVIALGGNGFTRPRLVTTRLGASLDELILGELVRTQKDGEPPRVISGSVLSGREAQGSVAYLGRYHTQVCAVAQERRRSFLGWLSAVERGFSFAGTFSRSSSNRTLQPFTTAQNGRATALVPLDAFERLIPLDILTESLLRALLIKDTDQAQALGCLELDPEDLALCSFICPGKNDYGSVLLRNLEQIEREG